MTWVMRLSLLLMICGLGLGSDSAIPWGWRRSFLGSSEHVAVGAADQGWVALPVPSAGGGFTIGNWSAANWTATNAAGLELGTYGDVIAEAQDYYGVTSRSDVVCTQSGALAQASAWTSAFDDLWQSDDELYLDAVRLLIEQEQLAAASAIADGEAASTGLLELSLARFALVPKAVACALYNVDHFASGTAQCVQTTYRVGHSQALAQARSAASLLSSDPASAASALSQAYVMSAFADHSLTDLFSAGHLRTPRQPLLEACSNSIPSAALTAMRMHDEDGRNGLDVFNARGDRWTAWGDYFLFDAKSSRNRQLAMEAVQRSRSEIWAAFSNASAPDAFSALDLIPVVNAASPNNTCALFLVDSEGNLLARDPVDGLKAESTCGQTNGTCSWRTFESEVDCFGADSTVVTALNMFLWPPQIDFVPCADGYVSHAYGSLFTSHASRSAASSSLIYLVPFLFLLR